jgi:hypothetical protein
MSENVEMGLFFFLFVLWALHIQFKQKEWFCFN